MTTENQSMLNRLRRRAADNLRSRALRIWESRGGGFYGFVALLVFAYLEVRDIAGDLMALPGWSEMDVAFLMSFVIGNIIDAVMNTIRAALWPMTWITELGVGVRSALLLAGCYVGYRMVRPAVRRALMTAADPAQAVGTSRNLSRLPM